VPCAESVILFPGVIAAAKVPPRNGTLPVLRREGLITALNVEARLRQIRWQLTQAMAA